MRQSDSGGKHHLHIELTQRQYQLLCRQAQECGPPCPGDPLDLLFQAMERDDPNSVAVHQYKVFKMAAGKTSKSSAAALPRSLHSNT